MAVFCDALMMEAARTSETLVNFYQTTRRYNPEDSHLGLYLVTMSESPLFQLLNQLTDLKRTWYERCAIEGQPNYCLSERRTDLTFKHKYPFAHGHSRSNTRYRNIG
jgi:hypothetical protein